MENPDSERTPDVTEAAIRFGQTHSAATLNPASTTSELGTKLCPPMTLEWVQKEKP